MIESVITDAATIKGMPKIAGKVLEARRETWDGFSIRVFTRTQLFQHLDFGLLACENKFL